MGGGSSREDVKDRDWWNPGHDLNSEQLWMLWKPKQVFELV